MLALEKPRSRNRVKAAWSMRSRMELESCLALPWDKGERRRGFFIFDIFYLLSVLYRTSHVAVTVRCGT